ncbi:MAG: response regulator [Schwartzia sp.]|nr:response regulator [Schwartzia sp. (in: firmicutes)]
MTTNQEALPSLDELLPQTLFVLIVDGDASARENTQSELARFGVGSDCCGNEEQAMEMVLLHHARRQEYDLILVNRSLPTKSGMDLIKEIRALLGETSTVIILTDDDESNGKADAEKAGADVFMKKPLPAKAILQEFRQAALRSNSEQPSASVHATLDGRRILIAEDMTVNAEIVKQLLSINFMEVNHAKNGQEAVDYFLKSPQGYYDAILMDVRMPVMDGLAATEAIRASKHPDAKTIPIIALTTNYFDEDVQRSLAAGMDAHLEKPVEPNQIYRTLAELISKRQ